MRFLALTPRVPPAAGPPVPALSSFVQYQAANYFPALDALRGVAILLVVFHHIGYFKPVLLETLRENGRYGVSLFFVISGYLICTLLLRERRRAGRINLWAFYGRRTLRLLPLYYAVLLLYGLLILTGRCFSAAGTQLFLEKLPSYVFYYSNWLEQATNGPFFCAWSLAAEEQFYLGFGVLLLLLPARWLLPALVAALCTKFVVFQTIGYVSDDSTVWRIVFSYQEPIIWGVLLAFALEHRGVHRPLAAFVQSRTVVPGLAVLAAAWLVTHPMTHASTWDAQVLYLLLTLIVAGAVLQAPAAAHRRSMLRHIGRVSYGIYLFHMLVITVAWRLPLGANPLVHFVVSTTGVVILATVVHRYFEAPIIAFYKRRFPPASPNASAATEAPATVLQPGPTLAA